MPSSESQEHIAKALARAQAEFPSVPKNKVAKVRTKTGGEYHYKYADLSDVLKVTLPILAKNGIAFTQPIRLSQDGKFMRLVTRLVHESGEVIESDGIPLYEGSSPQDFGGQLTYARRYDGCSILGIAPDEDEDGNIASGKDAEISETEPSHMPLRVPTAEKKRDEYVQAKTADLAKDIEEQKAKAQLKQQLQASLKEKDAGRFRQQLEASVSDIGEARQMPEPRPPIGQAQPKPDDAPMSDAQRKMIFAISNKLGLSEADMLECLGSIGYEHLSELPKARVSAFLDVLDPDFKMHSRSPGRPQ